MTGPDYARVASTLIRIALRLASKSERNETETESADHRILPGIDRGAGS
jgi:hypothetical protein